MVEKVDQAGSDKLSSFERSTEVHKDVAWLQFFFERLSSTGWFNTIHDIKIYQVAIDVSHI